MTQNHTDAEFLNRARAAYQADGEVEFDDDAKVSRSTRHRNPQGAYVQAWVWVEFPQQCTSREHPASARSCQCDHAEGHEGIHICAQHALRWTR